MRYLGLHISLLECFLITGSVTPLEKYKIVQSINLILCDLLVWAFQEVVSFFLSLSLYSNRRQGCLLPCTAVDIAYKSDYSNTVYIVTPRRFSHQHHQAAWFTIFPLQQIRVLLRKASNSFHSLGFILILFLLTPLKQCMSTDDILALFLKNN